MNTNPLDSAFPLDYVRRYGSEDQFTSNEHEFGLSKREYFAAMAMQGLCAMNDKGITATSKEEAWKRLADNAVIIADSLIKALNEEGGQQ